jgi:catechol 2,3-dioxygenase-like lactoylglutathione lyase family enzyme
VAGKMSLQQLTTSDAGEHCGFPKEPDGQQTENPAEAFRVTNDEGQVGLAYLRVSDSTFVELAPANEDRPAGLTHFGIQVDDIEAVKAMYESRGASPTDIFTGFTKARLSNIVDPQGVQIELSEYPPESLQGQALAGR